MKINTWVRTAILVCLTVSAPIIAAKTYADKSSPLAADWAFQPLRKVSPPSEPHAAGPIDRFILARLTAARLTMNPQADRKTLIRRATFDLTGLPPTPEAIDAFVKDNSPNAYDTLVNRLLSSPQYGERWARHWLDLARYADSEGYEPDGDRPNAYPYRDWVIRALNADMPYDRFVRLQLAADEEEPTSAADWAATGFCTAGIHNYFTVANEGTPEEREQYRYDELDDMLATTCSTFLGFTVGCARCHDHKFDPIPTKDYYRMMAAFTGTKREERSLEADAGKKPVSKPSDQAKCLGLTDTSAVPEVSYLLQRGDPTHKAEKVTFGVLTAFHRPEPAGPVRPPGASTTYQRLALARWLTETEHGAGMQTARVMVNRIWQHHFGEGLVRTPNGFGRMGDRPENPELLDWLAAELIRNGWRLKPIHRLIMLSAVYRQSTAVDAVRLARDPENRLFSRRRPIHLEAEALRDSILAVSGGLNQTMYGAPIKPAVPSEAMAGRNKDDKVKRPEADAPDQWRRSIYLFVKRSIPTPLLESFDSPNTTICTGRRNVSTVSTQALALLNDAWVRNQARLFAERIRKETHGADPEAIRRAYLLALGRSPTQAELDTASRFLSKQSGTNGLTDLCQVILTLNEFIYID